MEKEQSDRIIEKFVDVLNSAYDADPAAIHALLCNRVPCNQELADHPSIVVVENKATPDPGYTVGLLGILNGICGALTGRTVSVTLENDVRRITGFAEARQTDHATGT